MAGDAATDWKAAFEETYAGSPSRVMERVWRSVLGDEYPQGLDPYSYVTRSDLRRIADEASVGPGRTLVDVGCGRGGAGLWVAATTGARLVGIDIAEAPLVAARERAAAMGMDATFRRGEFEATGLKTGTADALMSVDALLFTPDKARALAELRRILRPGGRLVLTSWDYLGQPPNRPPQVPDHRPLLAPAGFRLLAYDETPDWRTSMERMHAGLADDVDAYAAEQGLPVDEVRTRLSEMHATTAFMTRRFLLVAEAV